MFRRLMPFMLLMFAAAMSLSSCVVVVPFGMPPFSLQWREQVVQEPKALFVRSKILMVDFTGPIVSEDMDGVFGEDINTPERVRGILEKARKDHRIKAVLLRINSPGGGAVASDIIHDEILRYKEETKIPVYAWTMDVCASGGYYVACAADEMWAHPGAVIGSIGVISVFPSIEGTLRWAQVNMQVIKSGEAKDGGAFWRTLSSEEREHYQLIVNDFYARFVNVVETGRGERLKGEIDDVADGRVFMASDALKSGLIDETMQLQDAIKRIKEEQDLRDAWVVTYNRGFGNKENVYANYMGGAPQAAQRGAGASPASPLDGAVPAGLARLFHNLTSPTFQYLWMPGH